MYTHEGNDVSFLHHWVALYERVNQVGAVLVQLRLYEELNQVPKEKNEDSTAQQAAQTVKLTLV